jgi:hypothetical protein
MSPKQIAGVALGAVLALLLVALPSAAHADSKLAEQQLTDATGGATVHAELWRRSSDGAVYGRVVVADTAGDGICAHASLNWLHENGNTYFDTGMWVCGYGTSRTFTPGARNWTKYRQVSVSASVDNGGAASRLLASFETSGQGDIGGPPDAGVGRPPAAGVGGPCESRWMTAASSKGDGSEFKVSMTPTRRARWSGRSPASWLAIWSDLRRCAPFPDSLTRSQERSLYKQLACHAVFGVHKELGGPEWDLEARHPNIPWSVVLGPAAVAVHECNWGDVKLPRSQKRKARLGGGSDDSKLRSRIGGSPKAGLGGGTAQAGLGGG